MKEEKKGKGRKNFSWLTVVLILVIAVGTFLRFYHFSDWLHFELDQSRDARVVDDALSGGPGELTLLGMKAGGTSLRLGPGFYYLEYLSGLVFGPDPIGMAMFVPILSVFSIVLFFLFARRYFSKWLSIGLSFLFSVSAFLTMYGRFAWNPNPIPFFALLGFYSMLRSVETDGRYRGRWLVVAAFSIGFATHLHFLAFLALPAIAVSFLFIRRPRFPFRVWLVAGFAASVLYLPVVLNEFSTGAANSEAFISAVTEKSTKEDHSLAAKLVRNVIEHGQGFLVVSSGYEWGDFFEFRNVGTGIETVCDAGCRNGWPYVAGSMAVFFLGSLSLLGLWWKEHDRRRADLLLLSLLWLLIPFFLYLPLAYGFAPRFFLVTAPVPFLLLGFLSEAAGRIFPWKKAVLAGTAIGIVILSASNLYYLFHRFDQLERAPHESVLSPADRILKEKARVTYEQQSAIVGYLGAEADRTGYPVYMHSEPQHRRALKYMLERAGVRNDVLGLAGIYEEGIYVLILRSRSDLHDGMKKYLVQYDVVGTRAFGTLTMIEFRPKPEAVQAERQTFRDDVPVADNLDAFPRYTWREWWERRNDSSNDTDEGED